MYTYIRHDVECQMRGGNKMLRESALENISQIEKAGVGFMEEEVSFSLYLEE